MSDPTRSLGAVMGDMAQSDDTPPVHRKALEEAQERGPYDFWMSALAGDPLPVHDEPEAGFYRRKNRDGTWTGIAIWFEDGAPLFLAGEKLVEQHTVWPYCAKNPVSEAHYRAWKETDRWHDDPPEAKGSVLGDNLPEDPFERAKAELAAEAETAGEFLAKPIETQEQADMAATWAKKIGTIASGLETDRKAEKKPHLDAGREVDAKYKPLVDEATTLMRRLKKHVEPFLIKQEREQQEAARQAAQTAQEPDPAPEPARRTSAGRTGATVALRTVRKAVVTDYPKAAMAFIDDPDLRLTIEKLARAAMRDGENPPEGVEYRNERTAA